MITILSFIVVVGVIVFVHELGHFLAAKLCGVRVEVFSLGFPPRLWSRKVGETEYQIAWVPLGGFVKMSGMSDESFDADYDPNDPRGFEAQPFIRKFFIITAGVLMNILLGCLIYGALAWAEGVGRITGTTLTMVSDEYPAAAAGLTVGDKVIEVAGEKVESWDQLTKSVRKHPGLPISISWLRGDSLMSAEVTPRPTPEFNIGRTQTDTVGKIGIVGTVTVEGVGPVEAAYYGAEQVWLVLRLNAVSLAVLVTGRASIKELTGPLGIAKMSGESARSGAATFFSFIGLISVSIAFLNMLPVPMLDGGHLAFSIIEGVTRRRIPEKVKVSLLKVGLAALILLMVVVSYHDIIRFYLGGN